MKNLVMIVCVTFCFFISNSSGFARSEKTVVGRLETVNFPKHGMSFKARIDTGAHTSSLHVSHYKLVKIGNETYIEFDTEDSNGNKYHIKTKVHKESSVRNTSGEKESRYVIREEVKLGKMTKLIDINLNDRTELKYKFLAGRNILRGDFVVDVSESHLLGK